MRPDDRELDDEIRAHLAISRDAVAVTVSEAI